MNLQKNLQLLQIEKGDQRLLMKKLPDMFELKVTLQKMLSIKIEEELEILVGSNMRGDRKLDESVSTKLLTGSDVSHCSKSMLNYRGKILFELSLLSFPNNDSIISFVKLFTCRMGVDK